jgi:hypothetical protein
MRTKAYALLTLIFGLLILTGCARTAPSMFFPSIAKSEATKEIAADTAETERYNTLALEQKHRRLRMNGNQGLPSDWGQEGSRDNKNDKQEPDSSGAEMKLVPTGLNQDASKITTFQMQSQRFPGFPVIFPNYSGNDLIVKIMDEGATEVWDLGIIKHGDLTTKAQLEVGIYQIYWNVVGSNVVCQKPFRVSSLPDFHIRIDNQNFDYYGGFRFYGEDEHNETRVFGGHAFHKQY